MKGEAVVNWDNEKARRAFLQGIVADADQVLEMLRQYRAGELGGSVRRQSIIKAAELLGQLLLQDVERKEDGVVLKEGVSRDRIVSLHDTEISHGHKSSHNRFDGHKTAMAVDTDSQLITSVALLSRNARDSVGALALVEQSEDNTGMEVEKTIGDCAYGDSATRQAFAEAERTLIAKVPGHPNCVSAKNRRGRTVRLHPQEALLQQARALQHSEAFIEYRKQRHVSEHHLARLVQLGIRQARYFGRAKTLFQLLMAATVANLTLVATMIFMVWL